MTFLLELLGILAIAAGLYYPGRRALSRYLGEDLSVHAVAMLAAVLLSLIVYSATTYSFFAHGLQHSEYGLAGLLLAWALFIPLALLVALLGCAATYLLHGIEKLRERLS
jgi:hypothetical protein